MRRNNATVAGLVGALLVLLAVGTATAQSKETTIALGDAGPVLTVLAPRVFEKLAIYPLAADAVADDSKYEHLDKAVSKKTVVITEWGSGTVPNLKVANKGKGKVFVMTGEIMTGARQDRMSAHDVLLAPGSGAVKLPVYCVEQGRWVSKGERFAAGHTAGTMKLRKSAVAKSSQGQIWSDVAAKSAESGVRSATGTMQAVYDNAQLGNKIKSYEKAFADLPARTPNMVGFVVAVGGRLETADLFANPPLLDGLWQKLVKAAATDAVTNEQDPASQPTADQVRAFLGAGIAGAYKPVDNPGLGKEFLIEGESGVSGSTLIHEARVVHMALFAPERQSGPRQLQGGVRYDTPGASNDNLGGKGSISNGGPPAWLYKDKKKSKAGKSDKGKSGGQKPGSEQQQQRNKKSKPSSKSKKSSWEDGLEK